MVIITIIITIIIIIIIIIIMTALDAGMAPHEQEGQDWRPGQEAHPQGREYGVI